MEFFRNLYRSIKSTKPNNIQAPIVITYNVYVITWCMSQHKHQGMMIFPWGVRQKIIEYYMSWYNEREGIQCAFCLTINFEGPIMKFNEFVSCMSCATSDFTCYPRRTLDDYKTRYTKSQRGAYIDQTIDQNIVLDYRAYCDPTLKDDKSLNYEQAIYKDDRVCLPPIRIPNDQTCFSPPLDTDKYGSDLWILSNINTDPFVIAADYYHSWLAAEIFNIRKIDYDDPAIDLGFI